MIHLEKRFYSNIDFTAMFVTSLKIVCERVEDENLVAKER